MKLEGAYKAVLLITLRSCLSRYQDSRRSNEVCNQVIPGLGNTPGPGVLGIIRIVIYLFYYLYFIMTPWSDTGLRTAISEDDNL